MESPTSLGVNKRLNNGGVNMTFINEKKERVEIVVRTMLDYHGTAHIGLRTSISRRSESESLSA